MSVDPPSTQRQPRLRSSCDTCGAAKLKCDRGLPECGRCISYGIPCVYGLSRRMGRRPQERRRRPAKQRTNDEIVSASSNPLDTANAGGSGGSTSDGDGDPFSSASDIGTSVWDAGDNNSNLTINLDTLEEFSPSFLNFISLDFGGAPSAENAADNLLPGNGFGTRSTPASPNLDSYSSTGMSLGQNNATAHRLQSGMSAQSDVISLSPDAMRRHDCPMEAYKILGALSFLDPAQASSRRSSSSLPEMSANQVPLDHVLRMNRDASDRLGRLFSCTCSRSPNLALLYVSILYRILAWYEQAAGCTQNSPWNTKINLDSEPRHISLAASPRENSTWLGTPLTSRACERSSSTSTTQSTGLVISPAKMAIGTFKVDDFHVQSALKIQLLLGELRRAGRLIDHFSSHAAGNQFGVDDMGFGEADSLYQNLESWLRGEHSRIGSMIRSRLKEIST